MDPVSRKHSKARQELKPIYFRKAMVSKKQTRNRAKKILEFLFLDEKAAVEESDNYVDEESDNFDEETSDNSNWINCHQGANSDDIPSSILHSAAIRIIPANSIKCSICTDDEILRDRDEDHKIGDESDYYCSSEEIENDENVNQKTATTTQDFEEAIFDEENGEIDPDHHSNLISKDSNMNKFSSTFTSMSCDTEKEAAFSDFISSWVVKNRISRTAANSLLHGLRSFKSGIKNFDRLPKDCRTLLQTRRKLTLTKMRGGSYFHFGIVEYLKRRLLKSKDHYSSRSAIELLINIDGLPLSKNSSSSSFWPILGLIRGEKTPFVIGVFHGLKKPQCVNEYLSPFVEEFIEIRDTGGIDHTTTSGSTIKIQVKIVAIVCDAPAKCMASGTAGHTSKVYFLN